MKTYDLKKNSAENENYLTGDAFPGRVFVMQRTDGDALAPWDLTDPGTTIKIQFRRGSKDGELAKEISIGNGITLVESDDNNKFQIDPFKIEFEPGLYYYDIEMAEDGNTTTPITPIGGNFPIDQDTTK